jgi:hypothetical protein
MDYKAKSFCKRYNAKIETSKYRISKIKKDGVRFSPEEVIADPALDIEYQQMVAIHLPQAEACDLVENDYWLNERLRTPNGIGRGVESIIQQHQKECRARNENPAVKAAYEKYLALLNLTGSHYADDT